MEVSCDGTVVGALHEGVASASRLILPMTCEPHVLEVAGRDVTSGERTVVFDIAVKPEINSVTYIAFVPPRPNPFARRRNSSARWFITSWSAEA